MINILRKNDHIILRLQPNRSASWQQTRWMIAALSSLMLFFGISWWIQGAWMVMLFAIVNSLLVAYLFHRVSSASYQRQILNIHQHCVHFCSGTTTLSPWQKLQRPCYLITEKTASKQHLPRYTLTDDQHSLQIGHFLNKEDLQLLHTQLCQLGFIEVSASS